MLTQRLFERIHTAKVRNRRKRTCGGGKHKEMKHVTGSESISQPVDVTMFTWVIVELAGMLKCPDIRNSSRCQTRPGRMMIFCTVVLLSLYSFIFSKSSTCYLAIKAKYIKHHLLRKGFSPGTSPLVRDDALIFAKHEYPLIQIRIHVKKTIYGGKITAYFGKELHMGIVTGLNKSSWCFRIFAITISAVL